MSASTLATDQQHERGTRDDDHQLEAGTEKTLSTDQMFHLLQNERRRLTLEYLQGTEGVVDMREIVENVAATEYGTDVNALSSTERQRVYIALYQSHLPKLADSGVIEYDQSRGRVSRTELADDLDPYLTDASAAEADVASSERRWDWYYLAASAIAASVLLASWLLSTVSLSGYAVAAMVVAGFGGLALAHRVARE